MIVLKAVKAMITPEWLIRYFINMLYKNSPMYNFTVTIWFLSLKIQGQYEYCPWIWSKASIRVFFSTSSIHHLIFLLQLLHTPIIFNSSFFHRCFLSFTFSFSSKISFSLKNIKHSLFDIKALISNTYFYSYFPLSLDFILKGQSS